MCTFYEYIVLGHAHMIVSFMYCTLQPACLVFYLVCYPVWGVWSSGKTPQKLHCSCCGDLAMVRSWVSEQCKPNALLWNSLEIIVNDVRFQIWGLMCTIMYIHHIWYVYAKEKSLNCVLDSFAACHVFIGIWCTGTTGKHMAECSFAVQFQMRSDFFSHSLS